MFFDTSNLKSSELTLRLNKTAEADPERGWSPHYDFAICLADGTEAGHINFRVGYNERLYYGGHIGYTVFEPFQGHHYAGKACLLLFELARMHGMEYLYITCTPENIASRKTCEYVGGVLEAVVDLPPDNDMYLEGERQKCVYRVELPQAFESRDWYYDEFRHVGLDFEDPEEVRRYDDELGKGINQRDNCDAIAEALGLKSTDRVLEIGTATGRLAMDLAGVCGHVYAIDISEAMLAYAREKAKKQGLENIEFVKAGFLSCKYKANTLDAVITKFALHHLPDHWKFVAVKRIYDMLKPGGKLYLKDATISVGIHDFFRSADWWIEGTREMSGDKPAEATALCIKEEYPTYQWIMEGMLERVGFRIDSVNNMYGLHSTFVCSKPS